jgi:tRNA(Ile)-lysidine synthase
VDILAAISRAIRKHDLIPRGATVIVGVSGGPDSMCLLHALASLRGELDIALHVAHLNHCLRGAEADADAEFVRDLAARWGLACTVAKRDVAAMAREHGLSVEEAARQARYAFLAEIALACNSHTIAVAHNADDQAESVLMHFIRGSGSVGLRGMLPISNLQSLTLPFEMRDWRLILIRPLLTVPRAEIERYCREHDLQPRFDASNLDTSFFRNRLRHELLPLLETYNPNIREVLRRTADVIAADVETLREAAEAAWREALVSESDDAIVFDLGAWRGLALAMQRATLREALRRLRPSLRNINFVHIDAAVTCLQAAQTGARVTLPQRLMLGVEYSTFTIADAARESPLPGWPLAAIPQTTPIRVPGVTALPDSDWQLDATLLDTWSDAIFANPDRWTAYLDADATGPVLAIRTRRPGDQFHPQGMSSPLRLANWMTNAKIPRDIRERLPVVVAGERIAWVAGFRIGQPFAVTPSTHHVLRLSFRL